MSTEFLDYVEDMLDAMEKAEMLLQDVTYEQFVADFRIHFVAVRALEIVGEAAKRMPANIRDQYPAVPWRSMAGMRDRIIHAYDNVDLEIVWNAVTTEIPRVKPLLRQILANSGSSAI